jgi:hypothetical protein
MEITIKLKYRKQPYIIRIGALSAPLLAPKKMKVIT